MKNSELRLIADKGLLFFLEQFKIEDAEYEKTKELLKRKISGENPSFDEWRANAIANAIPNVNVNANAIAIAIPNVNAIDRAYGATIAYDAAYAYGRDSDAAVKYILSLLGDYVPPINNLDAMILDAVKGPHCNLVMDDFHSCKTTHCRAGWAMTISTVGDKLEEYFGPWMAGALIYQKSTGAIPDFFETDDNAMKSMRFAAR